MKIMVIGAGGVGGYFGGRLVQGGADVSFVVRGARLNALRTHGLRLRSPEGDATLTVNAVEQSEIKPDHDVALVACKAYDLDTAIPAIEQGLARDGFVVPLLNGLDHLDLLSARLGPERVAGGVAKIGATVDADGVIVHNSAAKDMVVGELSGGSSARMDKLGAALSAAPGMKGDISPAIMDALWEKFVFLGTLAAATSLWRANVGSIAQTQFGSRIMCDALEAALAAAVFYGYPVQDERAAGMRSTFNDKNSPASSSLLRDFVAGRRTEADHIIGSLMRRIQAAGQDDTLFQIALTNLTIST